MGNAHTLATLGEREVFEISILNLLGSVGIWAVSFSRMEWEKAFSTALRAGAVKEIGIPFLPHSYKFRSRTGGT